MVMSGARSMVDGRRSEMALVLPLVMVLCAMGTTVWAPTPVSGQAPDTGDWVIVNRTVVLDQNISLDGDLIVEGTGDLTLDNVTLTMGPGMRVLVKAGGRLTIKDGHVRAGDVVNGYYFEVEQGELVLEGSSVTGMIGGGITVGNGELTMKGSDVVSSIGTGIYLHLSDATIEDSRVSGNGEYGIVIEGPSNVRLVRTTVADNSDVGVLVSDGATPELIDCVISGNARDGVRVTGSSPTLTGNRVVNNGGHGISVEDAPGGVSLNGDTIVGNAGWGVISNGGTVVMEGVTFDEGANPNALGRSSRSWALTVTVAGPNEQAVKDAEVTITSRTGVVHGPVLTDQDGDVFFDRVIEQRIWNNGTMGAENPYVVHVEMKVDGTTLEKDMEMNITDDRELKMELEQGDLAVSNFHVSDSSFVKGDDVEVSAIVSNIGGVDVGGFAVTFYDGSKVIRTKRYDGLDAGMSMDVAARWDTGDLAIGKHSVRVVVDPVNELAEKDETNNELKEKAIVEDSPLMSYAIPILIVVGVLGLVGFKLYSWALVRRLERKQKDRKKRRKGEDTVEFTAIEEE